MRLKWLDLVGALEHRGGGQYGVDPADGRVRFFDVHELESDDPRELLDTDRYLMVDPITDWTLQSWVTEFAKMLGKPDLADAADSARPTREIRHRLAGDSAGLAAWNDFYRNRLQAAAEAWASATGLVPENLPPWSEQDE